MLTQEQFDMINDFLNNLLKKKIKFLDFVYDDDNELIGFLTRNGEYIELNNNQIKKLKEFLLSNQIPF